MSLLLKSGTVLCHDDTDQVITRKADVLIEGSRITKIEDSISPLADTEVIDCTNKLVSPGFVDTHHHVWQSAFKGVFGDMALLPYLAMSKSAPKLSSFNAINADNIMQLMPPALNLQKRTCSGPTCQATWKHSTLAQPPRSIMRT